MIDLTKRENRMPVGYAWINGKSTLMYNSREIRRGKNKGKIECWYRKSATKWRSIALDPAKIKPLPVTVANDFNYNNPCPLCGKWLFHDEASPDCPNTKGD